MVRAESGVASTKWVFEGTIVRYCKGEFHVDARKDVEILGRGEVRKGGFRRRKGETL